MKFPVAGHSVAFPGFSSLGFALIGIDSTLPCAFSNEDNYGLVQAETAEEAANLLDSLLPSDSRLIRIAAMHHCPNPLADVNSNGSFLRNARDVRSKLAKGGFQLTLCGHEHQQTTYGDLRTGHQIFCTGSYGLHAAALHIRYAGDPILISNRYQIFFLHDDLAKIHCMLRKLSHPGGLDSRWTRDDDYGPDEFPVMPKEPFSGNGADPREIVINFGNPIPHPHRPDIFIVSVALAGPEDAMRGLHAARYLTPDGSVNRNSVHESFRAELELRREVKSLQVQLIRHSPSAPMVTVSVPVPPGPVS